jgi:hypothetical protein
VGLAGESHKRDFGHNFGSGLVWEKENEEGNAFRGLEWDAEDRGKRTAVRRSKVATASECRGRKGRGRGKAGRQGPLPHGGTSAVARGDRGVARQRWRRAAEVRQRRTCAARVCEARAAAG